MHPLASACALQQPVRPLHRSFPLNAGDVRAHSVLAQACWMSSAVAPLMAPVTMWYLPAVAGSSRTL